MKKEERESGREGKWGERQREICFLFFFRFGVVFFFFATNKTNSLFLETTS